MTFNRVLTLTGVALGALFVIQMSFGPRPILSASGGEPPVRRFHASWINNANTLADGKAQSDDVILGEVMELRKGPDIVVKAIGEPSGEDRIPTTIVKLAVKKRYKGAPGAVVKAADGEVVEMVELIQTGQVTDALLQPTPANMGPSPGGGKDDDENDNDDDGDKHHGHHGKGKGKGKASRPAGTSGNKSPSNPSAGDQRATILEDDPPFQIGERYILFLKDTNPAPGSAMAAAGVSPAMKRSLAPEGRYQVTKGDHLKPTTNRKGFAPNWKGRALSDFEGEVAK